MNTIETVVFDLDTTICLNTQSDDEIHRELFEQVAMEPPFTVAEVRSVDPANLPTTTSDRAFYENLYRAATENLTDSQYRNLAEATVEIVDETDVVFRDGTHETLQYIREQYDDLGLLTYGNPKTQRAKLDRLGITDVFDATVVCGPQTDIAGKPDAEAFQTVLAELGSSPETSIYIGDNLQGDIGGANNVGMYSAWVPEEEPPADPQPEPTYALTSPTDLREIL
ncbi:HAD family hydrolase [Halovenus rubra]|uniref:HAD family hydrolase n=2 Tax=Halovenus rubra TaxID=869890 RepID=A0ACC7DZI8_9EURY|nr:HAD family hydrolase [Halovenus rubra]